MKQQVNQLPCAVSKEERARYRQVVRELAQQFPEICLLDEPMARHTNYQVGGPADALVRPVTVKQLQQVVKRCYEAGVPVFVLGKGANILVSDEGIPGVVLSLEQCCAELFHEGHYLYVGAGRLVSELVAYCEQHGLGGLDFMSGIPGTVGGALMMNAGAFVGEIGDRVVRIEALSREGERIQISREQAGFGYRRADGLQGKIMLGCWLQLEPAETHRLTRARLEYLRRRAEKQPLEYPSCGSVFKRPPGDFAGRLIELVQGKGLRYGGAMVSEKHANFILNVDRARARDIYQLICLVQQKVYHKTGIWLEPEVKLVGFSREEVLQVLLPPDRAKAGEENRPEGRQIND